MGPPAKHHFLAVRWRYNNQGALWSGKVRVFGFFFKVSEKSGNSVKWSEKLENVQKSGKSQGIIKVCFVQTSQKLNNQI